VRKIHWIGDSTVAYNGAKTYPQTGIGQAFHLFCKPGYEILNYAKNGVSTKSFFESGRFLPVMENMKEGDILFIQFGHNDEKPDEERHTDASTTYKEFLKIYIDSTLEKKAYPVLISPLSRRGYDEQGRIIDSHTDYPMAMRELADTNGIPFIDLCHLSKDLLEDVGEDNSAKWFMIFPAGTYNNYDKDMVDNTHLHYEGAVVMAELVAYAMKELGGIYKEVLNLE
jgi:lysophospholipase L1-like esterase